MFSALPPESGPSMRVVRQPSLLRSSLSAMPWPSIRVEPDIPKRRQAQLLGNSRNIARTVVKTSKFSRDYLGACHPLRPVGQCPIDPLDHGVVRRDPGCEVGLVFRRSSRGPGRRRHHPCPRSRGSLSRWSRRSDPAHPAPDGACGTQQWLFAKRCFPDHDLQDAIEVIGQ